MNVTITTDYRYCRTPDGAVWTDSPWNYQLLTRYLDAFDSVNVVARAAEVTSLSPNHRRVDGPGISVSPVPCYLGPWQYLHQSREVNRAVRAALAPRDAVILNVPGQIANCLHAALAMGRPYAVQLQGDTYDAFAPGVIRHPLRRLLRRWYPRQVRRQAQGACGALYVTQSALQTRYPCPNHTVGVSDVDLPHDAFVRLPRRGASDSGTTTLVSVATMTQMYKGLDVLIDAVAECLHNGRDVRLILVGDGRCRHELEVRARHCGIADRVEFRGQLTPGEQVRAAIDAGDIFVLPSRTEGLPRALVEAMARGLPCLASRVGGIPELLADEDLLPPGDVATLARALSDVIADPLRRERMATRNLHKAGEYRADALGRRRTEFYRYVAKQTAEWALDTDVLRPAPAEKAKVTA